MKLFIDYNLIFQLDRKITSSIQYTTLKEKKREENSSEKEISRLK